MLPLWLEPMTFPDLSFTQRAFDRHCICNVTLSLQEGILMEPCHLPQQQFPFWEQQTLKWSFEKQQQHLFAMATSTLHALKTSPHHLKDTAFFTLHVLRSYIISTWPLVPQEMNLCTCLHCITYATNQPTGPVPGQLISLRNKQKHQENDYVKPPLKESGSEDSEAPPSESENEDVNYPSDSDEILSGEPFMTPPPSQWIDSF
ncbi:hypothetical protein O181_051684 [Austropuccinia psidii MF-1]|uniref:Uncharacterized protein n=1 Tax=Austropuccinia psidii MF-1 TaxID=1389203 RepID=A0A9Q3DZ72_9BASI|nr:hypothetical protein [Austropuccinia psidii MF-1]